MKLSTVVLALMVIAGSAIAQQERDVLLKEEFNSTSRWEQLTFPKIEKHTQYSIEQQDGNGILVARTDASASGLVYNKEFDAAKYPRLRWRWKVSNVYAKGDATSKKGDDYPIRIYITFKYDPDKAGFGLRTKYGLAKRFFGKYPPHSSLNYIWANRPHKKNVLVSPYTGRSIMIALRSGAGDAGKWVTEDVDIVEGYKKAFGKLPPATPASLAIMGDSDNTGEKATAYIDYIEIYRSVSKDKKGTSR